MEKTIKLAAIIPVIALSTTACAPNPMYHNNNAVAPSADTRVYSYPSRAVSSKTAVTHSHSGKIHSHPLPKTGIMHSHNVGTQARPASYRPTTVHRPKPQARPTAKPTARPLVQYKPRPTARPVARPYQPKPTTQARPQARPQVTQTYQAPVTKPVTATASLPSNNYSYYSYGTGGNTQAATKPKPTSSYYYNNQTTKPKPTTPSASTSYYNYYDYSAPAKATAPTPKPVTTSKTSTGTSSYYDSYTKPTTPNKPAVQASGDTYVVKRGDTVFQVMRNTGVYWKDIIRLNNLQAPEHKIVPGQRLRLK